MIDTCQRLTALNPEPLEHRNFLISTLVKNLLPDVKKQIFLNVVGWADQRYQFFEKSLQVNKKKKKLKSIILTLQIVSL